MPDLEEIADFCMPAWILGLVCAVLLIRLLVVRRRLLLAQKELELGLAAEKKQLLESIFAGIGDACLLVNPEGEVLFANEGASELFGLSLSLQGRRLSQIIPDERVTHFVARTFEGGAGALEDQFIVTVHPRGRKEERYLVVNAAQVHTNEGEPRQVRVVFRDETRQQETETIRRDFVANASHELRTPLSIINGYLENLLDGVIDDPAMSRKSLLTMQKHGERLARLVEDMLTISKLESAGDHTPAALRQQTFSCRECVESVLERLLPMFEQKKARQVLDMPPESDLAGDRFYWDQIFFNLIENALKENADDGRLVITVQMERQAGVAVIRVRDNGVGIPHEHLPFVFKRFYRVAKDHSQQKIKGTGLGLSIVKRAVEAHGGQIMVESSPGFRTEFQITLPDLPPQPEGDCGGI